MRNIMSKDPGVRCLFSGWIYDVDFESVCNGKARGIPNFRVDSIRSGYEVES